MSGKKGSGSGTGGKSSLVSSIAGALFKPNKWDLLFKLSKVGTLFRNGVKQYSAYTPPTKSLGTHIFGKKTVGYKVKTSLPFTTSKLISDYTQAPGYGTSWGTSFANGAGQYKSKSGFSKKALGLGVGAGFLGGAGLGVAGTLATYSVYHRYQVPDEGCSLKSTIFRSTDDCWPRGRGDTSGTLTTTPITIPPTR